MTITITRNEFNTVFININGELVADSATWNRQRGFSNKATGQWVIASEFTPRRIKADPDLALKFLALTGTPAPSDAVVVVAL
jgi:hypothetical protein